MWGNKCDSNLVPSTGFPNGVHYDLYIHTDINAAPNRRLEKGSLVCNHAQGEATHI